MLGRALCQELKSKHEIWGLDIKNVDRPLRGGSAFPFGEAAAPLRTSSLTACPERSRGVNRFIGCDITNKEKTITAIGEIKPDIVIHTAGYTDVDGCELNPDKAFRINGDGTENVAFACKKYKVIPAYISTDFVFDGTKDGQYNENDIPNPINTYGESKLKGEKAIQNILKDYFIIRTSWLFGKGGRNFIDTIIEKTKTQNMINVVSDQVGRPTYTVDLAKAIERLIADIKKVPFGIYHIASNGICSWYELACNAISLFKLKDVTIEPIKAVEYNSPTRRPSNSVLDIVKFESISEMKMRDYKEALKEYIGRIK